MLIKKTTYRTSKRERELLDEIKTGATLDDRRKALRQLAMIYRQRKYYSTNKDAIKHRRKAWIAKNPDRWRELARRNMKTYLQRRKDQKNEHEIK